MLKRLFIGLLIISALASEGIVGFQGTVYNLCFNSIKEIDVASESESIESTGFKTTAGREIVSIETGLSGGFVLTSGSYNIIKADAISVDSKPNGVSHFTGSTPFYPEEPIFRGTKDAIIMVADSSPPSI